MALDMAVVCARRRRWRRSPQWSGGNRRVPGGRGGLGVWHTEPPGILPPCPRRSLMTLMCSLPQRRPHLTVSWARTTLRPRSRLP